MPKYIANAYLSHEGSLVEPGATVELTEKQAERLKDKVAPVAENGELLIDTGKQYVEEDFRSLSADEQKSIVTFYEGDLKVLTNADQRWEFVAEKQK